VDYLAPFGYLFAGYIIIAKKVRACNEISIGVIPCDKPRKFFALSLGVRGWLVCQAFHTVKV
jgi:hypothetical protein